MNAGLNLYSIRNLIETEENFLDTAWTLKEMGYSYLQYSGAPYEPDRLRRVSQATGLPIVLTHVPLDRIVHDTDALMDEHASFGCKNIGLGSIPTNYLKDESLFLEGVSRLDQVGAYMENKGFHFYLHNHHYEFYHLPTIGTAFDYIVANAPHIHFTLDTYWLQYAGMDILSTIDRLHGRIGCVHLKDYNIQWTKNADLAPVYESVGYGNLDFKAIVSKMKEAGTEYFLVEQDNAANLPDTLHQVERSIRYILTEL